MFTNLYYKVLETDTSDLDQVFETTNFAHDIRKAIDKLRMDLEQAHRSTFD
jgi:hypothetical protein